MNSVSLDSDTVIFSNNERIKKYEFLQNLTTHLPTIQSETDEAFEINSFNSKSENNSNLWELTLPSINSSDIEDETTFYHRVVSKSFETDKGENLEQYENHIKSFVNSLSILASEDKIKNTRFSVHDLWDLSPIVLQDKFFTSKGQKYIDHKIPKSNLNSILNKIPQKFDISNTSKLKEFVLTPTILNIPNLPKRLDRTIDGIISFISKLNCTGKTKMDVFHDKDIDDFQLITIEFFVKHVTSNQCIQWTEELVSEIIKIDEDMLDLIQVEVIPDDN